jgi:hypothetical protein
VNNSALIATLAIALGGTMALVASTSVAARPRLASSRDGLGRGGHRSLRVRIGAAPRVERTRVVARAGLRGNCVPATTRPRGSDARSSSSVSIGHGNAGRVTSVGPLRAYQGTPPANGGDGPAKGGGVFAWIARQLSYQKKSVPLLRWPRHGFFHPRTWVDLMFDSVLVVLGLALLVFALGYADVVAAAVYRFLTGTLPFAGR